MSQHHRNLGIRVGANKAEIKKAYRTLAKRLHPDKNPDPKAAELFAELQDSYDALMNPTTSASSGSSTRKAQPPKQTAEERKQEARRRYAEHMRKQHESNERYFHSLTTGTRGLYFKIGMIICGIVILSIILDAFLPRHRSPDEFTSFSTLEREKFDTEIRSAIETKENGYYKLMNVEFFTLSSYPQLYVEKTRLLHFPDQIVHPVEGQLNKYKIQNSFWRMMPGPMLLFIFPAILLFYRKRTPAFTLLYMTCTYVVFPLTILFLVGNFRWLHLLSLGFF